MPLAKQTRQWYYIACPGGCHTDALLRRRLGNGWGTFFCTAGGVFLHFESKRERCALLQRSPIVFA